jgi:uncharacterized lipoprotein YmbA
MMMRRRSMGSWVGERFAVAASVLVHSPLLLLVAAAITVAGCSRSPDVRHFVLGTQHSSDSGQRAPDLAVLVGPIRLPAYLERPHFARRAGGGKIELDEFNRWLGGFEANLTNALAADLREQLGSVRVVGYPSSAPFPIDYSIRIHVDEWIVDESNTLRVQLRWALAGQGEGQAPLLSAHEKAIELRGRSPESMVEAYDRALAEFAQTLANALVETAASR